MQEHAIYIKDGHLRVYPWEQVPTYEKYGSFQDRLDAMVQGLKVRKFIREQNGSAVAKEGFINRTTNPSSRA
jgi:hypothetical protein